MRRVASALLIAIAPVCFLAAQQAVVEQPHFPGTFSILGYDPANPEPLKELRRHVEMNARRFQRK
jgi:hypothetical protein